MDQERQERETRKEKGGFASSAIVAFLIYGALTIGLTWPLAAGIAHDIPGDFGDPLFTSWVLSWDATHLGRGWWNANIFAPHPLSLAYSEHFLPQALQALPIYWATRNPILCYNLLFLSTFVLSAFGMFLLGRELTGSAAAGFVAGLAFGFAPSRIANIPHLQVLSAAWMPLVLFGLHRHFATGRLRPLIGASAAWLTQNLSSGYYLLFFTPIVLLYICWELTRRGRWPDRPTLARISVAIAGVVVGTAPFLLPYLELRRLGFSPRSLVETRRFSADVYAYFTADPNLWLWGSIAQAWPRSEGLLFPGLTTLGLAIIGVFFGGRLAVARSNIGRPERTALVAGAAISGVILTLLLGFSIRVPGIKITSLPRVLVFGLMAGAIGLAASRPLRKGARRWLTSPAGVFVAITLFALVMSLGPDIRAKGRIVAPTSVYALFFNYVPGFDGVRVPARYATIVTLGLAALAALGVAAIDARLRRRAAISAAILIVVEAFASPIPINQNSTQYTQAGLAPLPASIALGSAAPAVYRFATSLPESAVLLELPLGEPAFDIRYMFYSTLHWRRLVNGYSGGAPAPYGMLTESLKDVESRPERAWQAILDSSATHLVVHEASYDGAGGSRLSAWLRSRGARDVAAFGSDHVFVVPQR